MNSVIASGLAAPEGPTVGPDDFILNVCSLDRDQSLPTQGGDVMVTSISKPGVTRRVLSTSTRDTKGIPAALAFGPDEALYITDEGRRSITRALPGGECSDFITHYAGQRINGPNDLSFGPDGTLYFTDPWGSSPDNPIGAVYGYNWATEELHQIDEGMQFPNGVVVDGELLYVAETFANTVWAYRLEGDGSATAKTLFCRLPEIPGAEIDGPDGMAKDVDGNLFVAHLGSGCIYVYDGSGSLADTIEVGGDSPTNLAFGGPGHKTLYVTVDDLGELHAIGSGSAGATISFCPSTKTGHSWTPYLQSLFDS